MGPDLTSLPHQPAVNAPADKPSSAQTVKTEGVGKAVYASFKQMKSDLTEQISSIAKPVLKTISDNFSEKFTTARDQFVGLVGRFSPSLEQKMRTPKEIELQGSIEEQVANLDTIQSKISEIKKEPRRLLEKSIQEFSKIDEDVALEKKQIDLSIGTSASFIDTQEKNLQATQAQLLNASAKLGNMQADDIQTGDEYNPATTKQKEVCERLEEKITSKERSLDGLKKRHETLLQEREQKISDAEEAGKRAKELVKQTYHHDIAKLQGQILNLRREWSAGKGKLEEFKSEVTKSAPSLVHAKEFRKIDSTEKKVTAFFSSLGFIGKHDDRQFKITEKGIDDSLTAINSDKISPNSIREHFKTINEGITDLERRMRLAKMSGNEKLAEEIQTKITAIRSNPILAENPSQQLFEQQNEAKKLILSPDFKSASAQAKFKAIQEQIPARLQALALKAAIPQHYATVREVGPRLDPPTESQKEPIHDKTKRVIAEEKNFTAFVKKNPQLIGPAKVLMTALHEKVGLLKQIQEGTKPQLSESGLRALSDDIQKISDAMSSIENEVVHQEEVQALLEPERTILRELEHIKQALITARDTDSKLVLKQEGIEKWVEVQSRDIGLKSRQGTSEASEEALRFVLNSISGDSLDANIHTIAKEILDLLRVKPGEKTWAKSVIENHESLGVQLAITASFVDSKFATTKLDQQLTTLKSLLTTGKKEGHIITTELAPDTISYEMRLKKLDLSKPENLEEAAGYIEDILKIVEKSTVDPSLQAKGLEILKDLENSSWAKEVISQKPEIKGKIDGLKSGEVVGTIVPKTDKSAFIFNKELLGPPTNPDFQKKFLDTYRFIISSLTKDKSEKSDSAKLFSYFHMTFTNPMTSLYEKQQILKLAEQWVSDPNMNHHEVANLQQEIKTLAANAKASGSASLGVAANKLLASLDAALKILPTRVETRNGTASVDTLVTDITGRKLGKEEYRQAVQEFAGSLRTQGADRFKQIGLQEFTDSKIAANLQGSTAEFNKLSEFFLNKVSDLMRTQESLTPEKREEVNQQIANLFTFLTDVQSELLSGDPIDFNSFMSLQTVMTAAETSRLVPKEGDSPIKGKLSPAIVAKRKEFDELTSESANFKNLRKAMVQAKNEGVSFIPYLGLFLTDLTFSYDGNPSVEGKVQNLGKVLGYIEEIQQDVVSPTNETPVAYDMHSITNGKPYDKDEAYNLSLALKPRGS